MYLKRSRNNAHRYICFESGRIRLIETHKKDPPWLSCLGKSLFVLTASFLFFSLPVYAELPIGYMVGAGSASFQNDGTTLNITASKGAIINYQTFNIGQTNTVNIYSALSLHRILGGEPSQIFGHLNSTGKVFLVNPSGIFFGTGSQVNVQSLVASTLNISDQDFLAGKYIFTRDTSTSPGAIVNRGAINATESAALLGGAIENIGSIAAPQVDLAVGDRITYQIDPTVGINVTVDDSLKEKVANYNKAIQNSGALTGDTVKLQAKLAHSFYEISVNNDGLIKAQGFTRNAQGQVVAFAQTDDKTATILNNGTIQANGTPDQPNGGLVHLEGDTAINAGRIEATGAENGMGGTVHIIGDTVANLSNIDASGDKGGGTVLIGGDYQGKNPFIRNAVYTYAAPDSHIVADALKAGNGGKVVLWADKKTVFQGNIEARGGASSGDGGFVETSGHETLQALGQVDAGSAHGKAGQWLLDPNNITIQNSGSNTNISFSGGNPNTGTTTNDSAIVTSGSINTSLNAGTDVTIQTSTGGTNSQLGTITVAAGTTISKTSGGDATLTLKAHNSIVFSGASGNAISVSSNTNKLNVVLNADTDQATDGGVGGAIQLDYTTITSNGGNITLGGGANPLTTVAKGVSSTYTTGVKINNSSTLSADAGNISIRGQGRSIAGTTGLDGIMIAAGSKVQTTSGNITLAGTGGNGTSGNHGIEINGANSLVTTDSGAVTLNGTGGNSSSTTAGGSGLYLTTGGQITSTGIGTLDITGNSGNGTTLGNGVYLTGTNSRITSQTGDVTVHGTGKGTGTDNYGIYLQSGGQITSTGAAKLNITGTGANGTTNNYGIYAANANSLITSLNGDVTILGTGGNGSSSGNVGIYLGFGGQITSTGNAKLDITGNGGNGTSGNDGIYLIGTSLITSQTGNVTVHGTGNGTGTNNRGLYLISGGQITSTGAATLDITGIGNGTGSDYGIYLNGTSTTRITSQTGDVTVHGTASGTGASNYGINLTGGQITSIGAAKLNITGTSTVNGTSLNYGIYNTGLITSLNGDVTVLGTGGGDGTSTGNYGILLASGGKITSTGNALLDITGNAGNGTNTNYGIYLSSSTSQITSQTDDVTVHGTGKGTGTDNYGIYLQSGGQITSTGAAKLNITGTGANGTTNNYGVYLNGTSSLIPLISSQTGDISVIGIGGNGSATGNNGIYLGSYGKINSTGAANLTLTGVAGTGGSAYGLKGTDTNNIIGGNSMTGNLQLVSDTYSFNSTKLQTAGSLTYQPYTPSATLGFNGASGTAVSFDSTFFSTIDTTTVTPSKVVFGNSTLGSGLATIAGTWNLNSYSFPIEVYAGAITTGIITRNNGSLLLRALTGDITLTNGSSISANGTGTPLMLAASNNFLNNSGIANALSTPNGRWLVYASHPDTTVAGNLTYSKRYNRTFTGNPPTSITDTGNLMLYSVAPILTLTADNQSRTYGSANPTFTGALSGFINGDTAGSALTGAAGGFSTTATSTSNAGTYSIDPSLGTLASALGYQFSTASGTLTVNPAPLSITGNNDSRLYGASNPSFSASYSGFVLGQDASVLGGSLSLSTPATPASNVGNYNITPSGLTSSNYALTFNPGTLSVNPAPLSITGNNDSRLYGASNPSFSASYSGFVLGQDASVLGGSLSLSTPATPASNVGNYNITLQSTLNNANYNITLHDGILNVLALQPQVGTPLLQQSPQTPFLLNPIQSPNTVTPKQYLQEQQETFTDLATANKTNPVLVDGKQPPLLVPANYLDLKQKVPAIQNNDERKTPQKNQTVPNKQKALSSTQKARIAQSRQMKKSLNTLVDQYFKQ